MKKVIPKKKIAFPTESVDVTKKEIIGIAVKDSMTRVIGEYVEVKINNSHGICSFLAKSNINAGDLVTFNKDGMVVPYHV